MSITLCFLSTCIVILLIEPFVRIDTDASLQLWLFTECGTIISTRVYLLYKFRNWQSAEIVNRVSVRRGKNLFNGLPFRPREKNCCNAYETVATTLVYPISKVIFTTWAFNCAARKLLVTPLPRVYGVVKRDEREGCREPRSDGGLGAANGRPEKPIDKFHRDRSPRVDRK